MDARISEISRETKETKINAKLNLDGTGKSKIETGMGFFDHMLATLAKQGLFDLEITAKGDLEVLETSRDVAKGHTDLYVDQHHTVEDVGIVIGQLFNKALADKSGINRYGFFILPMDEALALAEIDLDGRCKLVFNASFESERVGEFETQLVQEFFEAFVRECRCSLQLKLLEGKNDHHKIEALFKGFARALRMACEIDEKRKNEIPSTKGVI